MLINTGFLYFLYFINDVSCRNNGLDWVKNVIKEIQDSHRVYQIMLISIEHSRGSRIQEMLHKIDGDMPFLSISHSSFTGKENFNFSRLSSLESPRDTTFFILIEISRDTINTTKTVEAMTFINALDESRNRPKCLVIHLSGSKQNSTFEKFLQDAWNNHFLDVSVLEVHVVKLENKGLVARTSYEIPILHYINPFNRMYVKRKYVHSSKIEMFPNKLLNMHGYGMGVGIFNRSPYSSVERNSVGHPVKMSGSDFSVSKILSEKMNFRIFFPPPRNAVNFYGRFSCNKNETTGFTYQLMHNQIQFISVRSIHITSICARSKTSLGVLGLTQYVAVAPVIKKSDRTMWVGQTFLYTMVSTGFILIIVYTIARVLRFDKRIWIFPNILQAILSLTIPELPHELKERMLFGCIFIISLVFSSDIYAAMTDFHYCSNSEVEFSTLKSLEESHLQLNIQQNLVEIIRGFEDHSVVRMLEKNSQRSDSTEECFAKMAKHNKIVCFSRLNIARMLIEQYKDAHGQPMMNIVPEILFKTVEGYLLEPGSPYPERFNFLILRIIQSGIFHKLETDSLSISTVKKNEVFHVLKELNSVKLPILLGVLIGGYSVSVIAFFGELVIKKIITAFAVAH